MADARPIVGVPIMQGKPWNTSLELYDGKERSRAMVAVGGGATSCAIIIGVAGQTKLWVRTAQFSVTSSDPYFSAAGVVPGDRVIVCHDNSTTREYTVDHVDARYNQSTLFFTTPLIAAVGRDKSNRAVVTFLPNALT